MPEETKQEVIRLSLLGYGRDEIARLAKISHGSATNIIEKWKNHMDKPETEAVRLNGLTPIQCATGLRIFNLMKRFGVKEDDIEQFLSEIYKKCETWGTIRGRARRIEHYKKR